MPCAKPSFHRAIGRTAASHVQAITGLRLVRSPPSSRSALVLAALILPQRTCPILCPPVELDVQDNTQEDLTSHRRCVLTDARPAAILSGTAAALGTISAAPARAADSLVEQLTAPIGEGVSVPTIDVDAAISVAANLIRVCKLPPASCCMSVHAKHQREAADASAIRMLCHSSSPESRASHTAVPSVSDAVTAATEAGSWQCGTAGPERGRQRGGLREAGTCHPGKRGSLHRENPSERPVVSAETIQTCCFVDVERFNRFGGSV